MTAYTVLMHMYRAVKIRVGDFKYGTFDNEFLSLSPLAPNRQILHYKDYFSLGTHCSHHHTPSDSCFQAPDTNTLNYLLTYLHMCYKVFITQLGYECSCQKQHLGPKLEESGLADPLLTSVTVKTSNFKFGTQLRF